MSNVISFLDRIGRNPDLRHADVDMLARALGNAQIDGDVEAALLAADGERLAQLLGAPTKVVCAIFTTEDADESGPAEISARRAVAG